MVAGEAAGVADDWYQTEIRLRPRPRGCHLVTEELLQAAPGIRDFAVGLLHVHILHTSASLSLQENADPSVMTDLARHFDELVPESAPHWTHTAEGSDDMPAHVKAALTGHALTLPLRDGRPVLGTWQGIVLCEHRNHGGGRCLVLTAHGRRRAVGA